MERKRTFHNEAFFAALDAERTSRRLSWKAVAEEAGVSASTLTRIGQGRRPDIDSFSSLSSWAGLDPDKFFEREESVKPASLTEISLLLRSDPNLSTDAAAAIDELVRATYARLRQSD